MPFADYQDMKDCIAKNQDQDDPAAYCATIMRAAEKRYNPNQPRDPAGSPTGGQWTGDGAVDDEGEDLSPSTLDELPPPPSTVFKPPIRGRENTGREWQQEWYETSSREAGRRARELRRLGYLVSVEGMGRQVTDVGSIGLTLVDIRTRKRFTVAKLDADKHEVYGWASVSINAGDRLVVDYQDDVIEPAELERAAHEYVRESGLANEMHAGEPVGKLIESLVVTPEKLTAMGLMRTSAPQVGWWVGFKVAPDSFAKVKGGDYRMFSIEGTADAVEV